MCYGADTGGQDAQGGGPSVAPSRPGVMAAARALQQRLEGIESSAELRGGDVPMMARAVEDVDGVMAAAAAEALAWEVTELPAELARSLGPQSSLTGLGMAM